MLLFYFPLITLSVLGYGYTISEKILNLKNENIGIYGINGIFSFILISYFSTQFIAHTKIFNLVVLILGIVFFLIFFKKIITNKKDLVLFSSLLILSLLFIFVGKNHDDFYYYHFPYILNLTEFPHQIGLGNLNHGFKTHSSIFLLNSMFHLPNTNYNLFHLGAAYIWLFSNFILIKFLLDKNIQKNYLFINFFTLASIILINIFFYRLGEHGTDRSAMILILLLFILILFFINDNSKKINQNNLIKMTIIFSLIISLKAFYIIYLLLLLPILFKIYEKKKNIKIIFNYAFLFSFALIFFTILTNFFNTGCLLFPEPKTCFTSMSWSLKLDVVNYLNLHYENWAKAGSGVGYENINKQEYVTNFNWVSNWVDKYFFNKVSDYLLSLLLIIIIFFFIFRKNKIKKKILRNYKFLYFIVIFIFLIWFFKHPSLRYGGYHLFLIIFFLPLSLYLENYSLKLANLHKKLIIFLIIIMVIFTYRNIYRLNKELKIYSYNPFIELNYSLHKDGFRINNRFLKMIENTSHCNNKSDKCNLEEHQLKKFYKNRFVILNN
tara:strand:+ start:299 stop:1951 length:1653 start_codon:yes stop_codon:yes gene_type:complete